MNPATHEQPDSAGPVFERALQLLHQAVVAGTDMACEKVLREFPQLGENGDQVLELIYTEYVLLEETGRPPSFESLVERFPQLETDLKELFQVHGHVSRNGTSSENTIIPPDRWLTAALDTPDRRTVGKYELLERIGRGGGGEVYRARHVALGRIVAIKLARNDASASADWQQRFRFEAEAAARLQHPNIVQIHEVGIHEGRPFIAMELISGGNLAQAIEVHPLSSRVAARISERLARGVDFAHRHGIVHRDLKPANVLLAFSDRSDAVKLDRISVNSGNIAGVEPKIGDFGLAKQLDSISMQTLPGTVLGTPAYMAPEQAQGNSKAVGPRTDIYALGAVLYHMLVGRPPFHAPTAVETLQRVQNDDPVSVRSIQPDVPRDLETICLKCLRREPERRYESAADLADDLCRLLDGQPILARPTPFWERATKWVRRHPAVSALLVSMLLGATGIATQWIRAEQNRIEAENRATNAQVAREAEQRERERLEQVVYARNVTLAQHALANNDTTRARQLLDATQEGFRNWEHRYLENLCHEELWDFNAGSSLLSVAISQDRKWVAAGTAVWGTNLPGAAWIWDLETGKVRHQLRGHPSSVMDVQFCPDNRHFATAGAVWRSEDDDGGKVILWDISTGQPVKEIADVHAAKIEFSPDGKLLAVGTFSSEIILFHVPDGEEIHRFRGHRQMILDLAFDSGGSWLASASRDGSCRRWNIQSGQGDLIADRLGDVRSIDFSPDGNDIALSTFAGDVKVFRLDQDTFHEVSSFQPARRARRIRYSPDGQYLAAAVVQSGVHFLDPMSGRVLSPFPGHGAGAQSVAFSEDGQFFATSGSDGHVKVWDLARPNRHSVIARTGPFFVDAVAIAGTNMLALAQGLNTTRGEIYLDHTVAMFDTNSGNITHSLEGHEAWLTCIDYSPEGRLVASGSDDQTICVWDIDSRQLRHRLRGHSDSIRDVMFANAGRSLVTVGADSTVRSWSLDSNGTSNVWEYPGGDLLGVAQLDRTETVFVVNREGTVHCRQLEDRADRLVIQTGKEIERFAASPDGSWLALACADHSVALYDCSCLPEGKLTLVHELMGHTGRITSLRFSVDGSRLISVGDDQMIKLWTVPAGQEVLQLLDDEVHTQSSALLDAMQNSLVVTVNNRINVWRTEPTNRRTDERRTNESGTSIDAWHLTESLSAERRKSWFAVVRHLDDLLKTESANVELRVRRGLAHAEIGTWDDASRDLGSPSASADANLNYQIALISLLQGDLDGYRKACETGLAQLNADSDVRSLNTALWNFSIHADSQVNWNAVLPHLERLNRVNSADYLNTIGAVNFRCQRHEQSISLLERSIELRGGAAAPFDWLFLGMNHSALGNPELTQLYQSKFEKWWNHQLSLRKHNRAADPILTWEVRAELAMLYDELLGMKQSVPPR